MNNTPDDFLFTTISKLTSCHSNDLLEQTLLNSIMQVKDIHQANLYQVFNQQGRTEKRGVKQQDLFWLQVPDGNKPKGHIKESLEQSLYIRGDNCSMFYQNVTGCFFFVKGRIGISQILHLQGLSSSSLIAQICRLIEIYGNIKLMLDTLTRDVLTSLPNRQAFNRALKHFENIRTFDRKKDRNSQPFLAIIDLDHFKHINDSYGHLMGDEVLIHFAKLLRSSFRYSDFVFRFGGEEFTLILNDIDKDRAHILLERFMEQVRNYAFPAVNRLTVTIGYTGVYELVAAADLIEQADKALYYGKMNGRNAAHLWQDLVKEQLIHTKPVPTGKIEIF